MEPKWKERNNYKKKKVYMNKFKKEWKDGVCLNINKKFKKETMGGKSYLKTNYKERMGRKCVLSLWVWVDAAN